MNPKELENHHHQLIHSMKHERMVNLKDEVNHHVEWMKWKYLKQGSEIDVPRWKQVKSKDCTGRGRRREGQSIFRSNATCCGRDTR